MTVDLSKIRPGDEVLIRATIDGLPPFPRSPWVTVRLGQSDLCIVRASLVVSHTPAPRPLGAGDRVELRSGGRGFIRAIIGERAWVDLVDDPHEHLNGCAYGLSHLKRIP